MQERLVDLVLFYPLLLLSLSVHESAHAWSANRLGDDTARLLGRITLNPLAHIDPIGTVLLPILAILTNAPLFGWAKPVPINPSRFKHLRKDSLWVAAAGPASNIALALIFATVFRSFGSGMASVAKEILVSGVFLNLVLAFFNMIPLFPLDGATVIRGLIDARHLAIYDHWQQYGMWILLALWFTGLLRYLFIPVRFFFQVFLGT